MYLKKLGLIGRVLFLFFCLVLSFAVLQCGGKTTNSSGETTNADLPRDISGLYIGMNKADAQKRLEEIAVFERDERKNQQIWKMKDASRFGTIAVGYDKEDKMRYITAFVDKDAVKDKIRFSNVGDVSTAKQEILQQHHRYIWEVPANGDKAAYFVNIYGDNPEFVTIYSLAGTPKPGESEEEEEAGE